MVPTEAHYRVATKLCGFPRHSQNKVTSVSRLCNEIFSTYINKVHGGRVVRCRTCDHEVVGSNPTNGCCVPTPTQRAIPPGSVNEHQQKLGSKRAYHAMQWPRIRGLAASAGVRSRAKEMEISAAPWALRLGKGLYFLDKQEH